jgi:hypothetical protein
MASTLNAITDVAQVRSAGGLSSDESTGAPTANQIEAAIMAGQMKLKKAVGSDVYVTVRDFSDDDLETPANQIQQDAFALGEAYFSIAALPFVAKNQQIGQSGMPTQSVVGQGTITYATAQESTDSVAIWIQLAYEAIADYLIRPDTTLETTELQYMKNPDDTGVESEDGEFSFIAI